MKKKYVLISLLVIFVIAIICGVGRYFFIKDYNEKYYVKEISGLNEVDFLHLTIKKYTLTKTSATIITTNTSDKAVEKYGLFKIFKKENDEWKELETDYWNHYVTTSKFEGFKGKYVEKINWKDIYGKLSSGEYRIAKIYCEKDCQNEESKKYYSVEFIIK